MQSDWHNLGDVIYRKCFIYNLKWKEHGISFEDYLVCGSQFGGPVAFIKDENRNINKKKEIIIFTLSAAKLSEITVEYNAKISGVGWNDLEQLMLVFEDGNCFSYNIHGSQVKSFKIHENSMFIKILECQFWGNGIVAIASDMIVYVTEGVAIGQMRKYAIKTGLSAERQYTSLAIIPPYLSRSNILEVMLGTPESSIIVAHENGLEDQLLQDRIAAPVSKIAVAPNGLFLACFRRDGVLTVLSTAFTTKVLDFDTKSLSRPLDIVWCGNDAVVMLWRNTGIVMVGPYGDWINFPYEGSVHLVAEHDCCRILTSTSSELLQRLPVPVEAVHKLGSTDPAALMYFAMEAFEEGDPKSDENIRSIAATNQLETAVQTCVAAATAEFDVPRQQSFLKAASYGKAFCADSDPSDFVCAALKLRVLNEVRRPEIGIPLTVQQYSVLTPEVLVKRLTVRNHHFLAMKICELLKIKTDRVIVHWASEKVKRMAPLALYTDEDIFSTIRSKLDEFGSKLKIAFQEVAEAAHHMGRRRLAKMILDLEEDASDQIPLLLSMKEEDAALQKAVTSQDTDLLYLVLLNLDSPKALDKATFYRMIQPYPEALSLLKAYYQTKVNLSASLTDKTLLSNFLLFNKNYIEAGIASVNQAYAQRSFDLKIQCLKECVQLFGMGRGDSLFLKTATEEQLELLDVQGTLELRSRQDFIGLSLSETLYSLVQLSVDQSTDPSWEREIAKLMKRFKISEKVLWHIRLQVYCRSNSWAAFNKLSNEKKSPIGYKPFALACIKYNRPAIETEGYVDKVTELEDKFDLYMELQSFRKAFDVASKLKDANRLTEVGNACKDPQLERLVQEMLSRI